MGFLTKLLRLIIDPSYTPRRQPLFGRGSNPFKIRKTRSDKGKRHRRGVKGKIKD